MRTSEGQCILPTAPSPCISDGLMDCLAWAARLPGTGTGRREGHSTWASIYRSGRKDLRLEAPAPSKADWQTGGTRRLPCISVGTWAADAPLPKAWVECTLVGRPGTPGCGGAILPPGIGADGGDGGGGGALACTLTRAAEKREIAAMRAGDKMGWTKAWSHQRAGEVGSWWVIGCKLDPP